ncbi:MFS transporter [Streptomyces sp. H10-C2]|uniref:MFS transporter n=1 Tax=unclassified Streptomyces TaxID=2593676 RepID=UPI0024BBBC6F|nr:MULTISPECIES: MFS transporter [unclassified Streptomyces]MDJ0343371.1 MFS transporter [Streptomyces sp. PH10-H1]MDJ0371818.1 MFS transporter [Streptomyces sp. H10-C2]
MVTDVSSEMVSAVLPLYLVLQLGLSPLAFGIFDSLYSGATVLVRLVGGHLADRRQRRKLVAGIGYALSAVCKLGLLAAGGSVGALGAVVAADRAGKGLRTAPRDALISLSTPAETLGLAFGVHRAMDTVGAFLGPLAAFGVLAATGTAYDAVFVVSFCVAVLGVVLLVSLVQDRQDPPPPGRSQAALPAAFGLLRAAAFRRTCVLTAALGLVTVSDSFLYLLLQRRLGIAPEYFPLLPLGTTGSYLLLAVPLGRIADRSGRFRMFLGGHLALLGAYAVLLGPAGGLLVLIPALILHGGFYAATDGVLMAAAGPLLPAGLRTSGLALLQTGQAGARLVSSIVLGAAWPAWGPHAGLAVMAAGLSGCLLVARFGFPMGDTPAADVPAGDVRVHDEEKTV